MKEDKNSHSSVDPEEVLQFDRNADAWWDPEGIFKPLHGMNPCRIQILKNHLCTHFNKNPFDAKPLAGISILDIGCGGGLLTEPLTRLGATVTGLDAGASNIAIAEAHAEAMGLSIVYHAKTAEIFAAEGHQYDCVLSLEVLEHLASIPSFLNACKKLLKPKGTLVLSTLNRTLKSFLGAVVMGEYVLKWLPRGTHDWKKFLRPSELATLLKHERLVVSSFVGMVYDPFIGEWKETRSIDINYFAMITHY